MAIQHRNIAHRFAQARQLLPGQGPQPKAGAGGRGSPANDASSTSAQPDPSDDPFTDDGPVFTRPSATPTPSSPPPPPPPPPTSQVARPTTTPPQAATTTSTTQTQPTTTDTPTSTSSSVRSSTSLSSILPITTPANTLVVPGHVATSSFATLSLTSLPGDFVTQSPSPTTDPDPTSGVKVGTVVGIIAGALVGIGILGLGVSFILRRLRKRNRRDTIIGEDFRRSQLGLDMDGPLDPPNMGQRHHSVTPSVASGPGMAGQGAFQGATAFSAGAAGYGAAAHNNAMLHERPRYTYGRAQNGTEEDTNENAYGVYSSQPQPQMPYNPEAYGSFATYEADPNAGYQDATRQYQEQHPYVQGGYDAQYAQYNNNYVVADLGPSAPAGAVAVVGASVGAHPTSRDPASMSGNRGPNTRSVVQDDDVYGGI